MSKILAKEILTAKAFIYRPENPFKWASGIDSPIYCDNRQILSFPIARKMFLKASVEFIKSNHPHIKQVAGVATAGIPMGALIAHELDLPYIYVRSKPKEHGRKALIEGCLNKELPTLVVEDLISTGKSSMEAINALRDANTKTSLLFSMFTYSLNKSKVLFEKEKIDTYSLVTIEELLSLDNFSKEDRLKVLNFLKGL